MKRFIKLLNIRLDKCFLHVVIMLVIQLLVITIAGALNISATNLALSEAQVSMSYNTITDFDFIFSNVATILSIIVISVLAVRIGDTKYYLPQGISSSDNMLINFSMGTILSLLVALVYYMGTLLGRLLATAINSDYYILDQVSTFAISAALWKNVALVFFVAIVVFLLFSCIYKTYIWNKSVAIIAVSCIITGIILFLLIGLPNLSESIMGKLFSPTSGVILGSIIAAFSASIYVAIELKGDITR